MRRTKDWCASSDSQNGVVLSANRTTRSVALTAAGDRYLVHCQSILDRLELAKAEAAGLCAKPVGRLRIGVDSTFDAHHLAWLIHSFQERYPEVTVQTSLVREFGRGFK
ncbi:MAG TPA: LysR family transcriptional regulator [Paraburkholderia sp.]|uniref:LysR family transcriptional regulator n=1 Tax=Paraburkholderia sp. TaxID=1926495 RepID=UPI002B467ED8|nr:LysR family transcriptional regulator [Paraburkholderia sp.]HKR43442.1 LysR family transcriptional regulator [Paraburkholderia sp.]